VASEVVKQLRADIIRGELAPAQKLRVDFVCTRYGVGSSPAREALGSGPINWFERVALS
jgi:DNA-binding GntR family transcriptional regulator